MSSPSKEAVSAFEKMRPAAMTVEELQIVETILLIEIGIAVRSMGNAKDFNDNDMEMLCTQILNAFVARYKVVSFATIILFFKMRRAKIAPCDAIQYGVNPMTIIDDFNKFMDWQRTKVAEENNRNPNKDLSLSQRSANLANTLANAPESVKKDFEALKQRLADNERKSKLEVKKVANLEFQTRRLTNILYLELKDMKAAEERCLQLLRAWQPANGDELKSYIDEEFNQQ